MQKLFGTRPKVSEESFAPCASLFCTPVQPQVAPVQEAFRSLGSKDLLPPSPNHFWEFSYFRPLSQALWFARTVGMQLPFLGKKTTSYTKTDNSTVASLGSSKTRLGLQVPPPTFGKMVCEHNSHQRPEHTNNSVPDGCTLSPTKPLANKENKDARDLARECHTSNQASEKSITWQALPLRFPQRIGYTRGSYPPPPKRLPN